MEMSQVFPQMTDNFDPDKISKYLAGIYGVPQDVMREEEARDQMREQMQQQQQEMIEAEQAQQQASVAETASKAASNLR